MHFNLSNGLGQIFHPVTPGVGLPDSYWVTQRDSICWLYKCQDWTGWIAP